MIAFLLLTHNSTPHAGRLVERLLSFSGSQIFCHHDYSKGEPDPRIPKHCNIVQPHRITGWSRVSSVLATLDLMSMAYQQMPNAEWFILLSGNCYPIKSAKEITQFLTQTKERGFLDSNLARKGVDLPGWWWTKVHTRPWISVPFVSRKGKPYMRPIRLPRKQTPFTKNMPLRYGSQWFILSRGIVEQVLAMNPHNHSVLTFFDFVEKTENKHMSLEESLFQTLLGEPSDSGISTDYLRFIDWENAKNWHPNTLSMRHWEAIRSSKSLFARKFDPIESAELIETIDRQFF